MILNLDPFFMSFWLDQETAETEMDTRMARNTFCGDFYQTFMIETPWPHKIFKS